MEETFRLSWGDFQKNVSETFSTLRDEKDFCDVTLVCDDESAISAHKLVLASCSSFFKNIFKNPNLVSNQTPVLYLQGVDSNILKLAMDYIYNGEAAIPESRLDTFLQTSTKLKLKGLIMAESSGPDPFNKGNNLMQTDDLTETSVLPKQAQANPDYEIMFTSTDDLSLVEQKNGAVKVDLEENPIAVPVYGKLQLDKDTEAKLQSMLMKLEGRRNYICLVCQKKCTDTTTGIFHVETHFPNLSYKCRDCDIVKNTRNQLRQHMTNWHKIKSSEVLQYLGFAREPLLSCQKTIEIIDAKNKYL